VKLTTSYVALCVAAVAFALWRMTFTPGNSELSAIGVVVLGLPWTAALPILMLGFRSSSAWLFLIAIPGSCVLNAWLLYRYESRRS
jgi:hypothetical protein